MPSAPEIEAFNRDFLGSIGPGGRYNRDRIFSSLGYAPTAQGDYGRGFSLNDRQRKEVQSAIERELGFQFPSGVEIDPAGNMNENEGFGKQLKKWGPVVGGAALTAFGIPGVMPGLFSGGAGAAASSAAGGLLPSSSIPTSLAMQAVPGAAAGGGMGWGSILGGIGKGILGGFKSDPLGSIGALGNVFSGQAQGSANQRMAEGNQALGFGALGLQGARDQFGAGMQGAQFQREGQDRERKAAMLMALLNGMQDLRLTPGNPAIAAAMGNVAGGARPSALTGGKEALLALLAKPQVEAPTYQAPGLPTQPRQGMGEKILGGLGMGGSILGALGGLGRR